MEYMESKMQDYIEAGQNEHDELTIEFNPPEDWCNPKWEEESRVHNWRNYANEGVIREWHNFSGRHKVMISSMLNEIAGDEHWD